MTAVFSEDALANTGQGNGLRLIGKRITVSFSDGKRV